MWKYCILNRNDSLGLNFYLFLSKWQAIQHSWCCGAPSHMMMKVPILHSQVLCQVGKAYYILLTIFLSYNEFIRMEPYCKLKNSCTWKLEFIDAHKAIILLEFVWGNHTVVSATLLIVRTNLAGQAGIPFFPHCSKVFPLEAEHSISQRELFFNQRYMRSWAPWQNIRTNQVCISKAWMTVLNLKSQAYPFMKYSIFVPYL